jgi:hypothetical protein
MQIRRSGASALAGPALGNADQGLPWALPTWRVSSTVQTLVRRFPKQAKHSGRGLERWPTLQSRFADRWPGPSSVANEHEESGTSGRLVARDSDRVSCSDGRAARSSFASEKGKLP